MIIPKYEPTPFIEEIRTILGGKIDLDPCSDAELNKTIKAECFFTEGQNGLVQDWSFARTIWCAPPLSAKLLPKFWEKFVAWHFIHQADASDHLGAFYLSDLSLAWSCSPNPFHLRHHGQGWDIVLLRDLPPWSRPHGVVFAQEYTGGCVLPELKDGWVL